MKQIWIDALRSGKYNQGKAWLRQEVNGEYKYCALGVLYDISGQGEWDYNRYKIDGVSSFGDFFKKIDLNPLALKVLAFNDILGKSFNEIADWLEENI